MGKIFKTYSQKEVKRVMPIVKKINELEEEISKLTDSELRAKTDYFKKVRIFASGQNIWTITGYKGYDPDFISDGLFSRGFEYGSFPSPRTISFGLEANF